MGAGALQIRKSVACIVYGRRDVATLKISKTETVMPGAWACS